MKSKKPNTVEGNVCCCCLPNTSAGKVLWIIDYTIILVSISLFIFGISMFLVGIHNNDTAFNMNTMERLSGLDLVDVSVNGIALDAENIHRNSISLFIDGTIFIVLGFSFLALRDLLNIGRSSHHVSNQRTHH